MIACLRTVVVPPEIRALHLAWIDKGREVRQAHGIVAELVLEPANNDGETVVLTIWPNHEVFDAWIATPERDRLTASEVHRAVNYRPITRYDVVGGYFNRAALALDVIDITDGPTKEEAP
jgi:heme-degrading monooxygenase HmoA